MIQFKNRNLFKFYLTMKYKFAWNNRYWIFQVFSTLKNVLKSFKQVMLRVSIFYGLDRRTKYY